MKNRMISLVAIAAALSMTAGCAAAGQLPPEPPSSRSAGRADRPQADQGQAGAAVPGSRADFLQSVVSDRIFFGFDSYSVDDEARRTLDAQADWLGRNPNVQVTIEGHADERGTREYNLALGDRRANAARDYLAVARRGGEPDAGDQLGQGTPGDRRLERKRLGPEPPRRDGGAGVGVLSIGAEDLSPGRTKEPTAIP